MMMNIKTIITVILSILSSCTGYSQINKGTLILSGKTDLNFLFSNTAISRDSISPNKMKSNQFAFKLGVGYFVANNLTVGVSGTYSYAYSKTEPFNYDPGSETITTTFGVIPQLSYYFPLEGKIKPSLTVGAGYLFLKERDSRVTVNNNTVYSLKGTSLNAAAGVSYFIIPSVTLDLGIQYTQNSLKDKLRVGEIQKNNIVAGIFGITIFFLK